MRHLIISLAVATLLPTWAVAQEKALPTAPPTAQAGIASFCDGMGANVLLNCGFEAGNFNYWDLSGASDYVTISSNAANSGSYGGSFGAIGDPTYLTTTIAIPPGQSYHVEFWLANMVGGSGTEVTVYWAPSATDAPQLLLDLTDADPFDWTLQTFGPLPATGDGAQLQFIFRHDPDYWFLDDIDVEPIA